MLRNYAAASQEKISTEQCVWRFRPGGTSLHPTHAKRIYNKLKSPYVLLL